MLAAAPYNNVVGLPYLGAVTPGVLRVSAAGLTETAKVNLSSATDPGVNNDSSSGYAVGSTWHNTTAGRVWTCNGAAVGAADWVLSGGGAGFGNPAGSGTEIQYRVNATTFGAVAGSSWDATTLTLPIVALPASVSTSTPLVIGDTTGRGIISQLGVATEPSNQASIYVCHTNGYGIAIFDKVYDATTDGPGVILRRARGTAAVPTNVADEDQFGYIDMRAYSGDRYWQMVSLAAKVDGTFTSGQAPPSRLTFHTNAANGSSTERIRVRANGYVGINTVNLPSVGYPTHLLHVYSSESACAAFERSSTSTTIGGVNGLSLANLNSTTNNWVGIIFGDTYGCNEGASGSIGMQLTNRTNHYGDFAIATRAADGYLERLRIMSSGNVGIGTTAPAALAHINSSTVSSRIKLTNSTTGVTATDGFDLQMESSAAYVWNYENGPLYVGVNNATAITVTAAGRVGIGITGPGAALEVASDNVTLSNMNLTDTRTMAITCGGQVYFWGKYTTGGAYAAFGQVSGSKESGTSGQTQGSLVFQVNTGGGATAVFEKMRLTSAGYLGVGTNTPQNTIHCRNFTGTTGGIRLSQDDINSNGVEIRHNQGDDTHGFSIYDANASAYRFSIDGSGNVGIGTASPSAKLNINGASSSLLFSDGGTHLISASGGTLQINSLDKILFNNGNYWIQNSPADYDLSYFRYNAGSPYLTIKDGGNVGIGTTGPGARLTVRGAGLTSQDFFHIEDSGGVRMFEITSNPNGDANLSLKNTIGTTIVGLSSNGDSYFTGGNVGIGTATPGANYALHILRPTTNTTLCLEQQGAGEETTIRLLGDSSRKNWEIGKQMVGNALSFASSTAVNGTTFTDYRLVLLDTGYVGVGQATPTSLLHVTGTDPSTSYNGVLRLDGTARCTIAMNSGAGGFGGITFFPTGTQDFYISSTDGPIILRPSSAEALRMAIGGNVGIGTGATVSAKLHVIATTEQLRLGYDAANYASFTVDSAGDLTISPSGGDVIIPTNKKLNLGTLNSVGSCLSATRTATANSEACIYVPYTSAYEGTYSLYVINYQSSGAVNASSRALQSTHLYNMSGGNSYHGKAIAALCQQAVAYPVTYSTVVEAYTLSGAACGPISFARGFYSYCVIGAGSTISDLRHFSVGESSGGGTLGTQYGLKIEDLTYAGTNWSIYTGTAASYFGGDVQIADAKNMVLNTTTGTKIGAATNQKLGFWGAAPVIQQTTGVAAATVVQNSGNAVNDATTFDGYTLAQLAKIIRTLGLAA
jgi:hypothetical protein